MAKRKDEEPVRELPRAERLMQQRLEANRQVVDAYEATLDPRQRLSGEVPMQK